SGTEGTIVNNGERFNELQVFRMREAKRDRGFTTIYCGSQVPQYSAFFGFDFAGGGLGYFDIKVFEVHDLVQGIGRNEGCFPDFEFGARNQEILRPSTSRFAPARGYRPILNPFMQRVLNPRHYE